MINWSYFPCIQYRIQCVVGNVLLCMLWILCRYMNREIRIFTRRVCVCVLCMRWFVYRECKRFPLPVEVNINFIPALFFSLLSALQFRYHRRAICIFRNVGWFHVRQNANSSPSLSTSITKNCVQTRICLPTFYAFPMFTELPGVTNEIDSRVWDGVRCSCTFCFTFFHSSIRLTNK